jgi:hypothetical protein
LAPLLTVASDFDPEVKKTRGVAQALQRKNPLFYGAGEAALAAASGQGRGLLRGMEDMLPLGQRVTDEGRDFEPETPVGRGLLRVLGLPMEVAHGVGEKLKDKLSGWGLPAALAAGVGAVPELAAGLAEHLTPRVESFANLPKNRVIPWKDLTTAEARATASQGLHLRREGRGYQGAPAGVGPKNIGDLRAKLDVAVAGGLEGADWYPKGREAISSSMGSPEAGGRLANIASAYSPQVSVPQSIELALGHMGARGVLGEEGAGRAMPALETSKAAAVRGARGERPGGPKTGPFAEGLDPSFDPANFSRSVNDTHMIQLFGYPKSGAKTKALTASQHSFVMGEMHLAHKRAVEAGVLPPASSVHEAQAAAWAGKRLAAGEAPEAIFQPFDKLFKRHEAPETFPALPSAPGHMEGARSLPLAEQERLAEALQWSAPGERDPIWEALEVPQGRTGKSRERLLSPALRDEAGRLHSGGATHSEVLLGLDPERSSAFEDSKHFAFSPSEAEAGFPDSWASGFLDRSVDHPEGKFVGRTEASRRASAAQPEGGEFGHYEGPMTSEEMLSKPPTFERREARPMLGHGPTDAAAMDQVRAFRAAMDARKDAGMPWGDEGSGAVTAEILDRVSPHAGKMLDASPGIADALRRKNVGEGAWASPGSTPRGDLQLLRHKVGSQGLEGVRAEVGDIAQKRGISLQEAAATLGLPAALLGLQQAAAPDEGP